MDVAFVEDAQDDVHGKEGGQDENRFAGQGSLEGLQSAGEAALDALGQADALFHLADGRDSIAQGDAGGKIERDRDAGKLALVTYADGGGGGHEPGDGAQGDLPAVGGAEV